jgi:hypothetical protein
MQPPVSASDAHFMERQLFCAHLPRFRRKSGWLSERKPVKNGYVTW